MANIKMDVSASSSIKVDVTASKILHLVGLMAAIYLLMHLIDWLMDSQGIPNLLIASTIVMQANNNLFPAPEPEKEKEKEKEQLDDQKKTD